MDSAAQSSNTDPCPLTGLGTWCYRGIFKENIIEEALKQQQNSPNSLPALEHPKAQSHESHHVNVPKEYLTIPVLQRALHKTDDEVQHCTDSQLEILAGRHPHRARLMRYFPRPPNMPDVVFMRSLWEEIKSAEKILCEDHLGADVTIQEGGYKMGFNLLQRIHGIKHMDDLLRKEVSLLWITYLHQDSGSKPLFVQPQQTILGSRKISTTKYIAPAVLMEHNSKRKDPPEGTFRTTKKARVGEKTVSALTPRRLPNLAEQGHHPRLLARRPRRASALRQEIHFE